MKKRCMLISIIFIVLLILGLNTKCFATDLDRIVNYEVTVDPRMNDGSLDITYKVTWKVLDSTTEGPLTWVQIGTANENFDNLVAHTDNIKSVRKYNGSYVRIDFKKAYYAGQEITFKYSLHQSYMYKITMFSNCNYSFTPAWFTDAEVENMTIKWNADQVKSSNKLMTKDNYLLWNKKNMSKGSKLTAKVKYKKSAFTALNSSKQRTNVKQSSGGSWVSLIFVTICIVLIISALVRSGGGSYYRHGGFYGGHHHSGFYGGCVHSSCACASSCVSSCACACAGSGRAGCSMKDFYGTNLNSKKVKKVLERK